jgi:tRNA dimethylallyltransferase
VEVAERVSGEIVSADAFAVYRGLDIGTDKPDLVARRRVRHHLLDVADPRQRFSAGEFAEAATEAIRDIRSRGKTPIVAGGTLFYVRALVMGLFPSPAHDPDVRSRLSAAWQEDPNVLLDTLRRVDPEASEKIGAHDRQRIIRALEVYEITSTPISEHWRRHRQAPRYRCLLSAPNRLRQDLYARIDARVVSMFASGLKEEVNQLLVSGVPRDAHALKAIGYRQVVEMLEGRWDRGTAIAQSQQASRKLAKRQLTWLRSLREGTLHWVPPEEQGGTETIIALWRLHIGGSERQ